MAPKPHKHNLINVEATLSYTSQIGTQKNRPIRLDGRLRNLPKSEQNGFPDELAWLRLFALLN